MALLFAESFDGLDSNSLKTKFQFEETSSFAITFPAGVIGNCASITSSTSPRSFYAPINSGSKTLIFGADILLSDASGGDVIKAGTANGNNNEDFELVRGINLITVRTGQANRGTYVPTQSVWVNIEIKCVKDNSTGTIEVRENGTSVFDDTGIDTQDTDGNWKYVGFEITSFDNIKIDNMYICDSTGDNNNDFLGQLRIETLYPNGNGESNDFVGSDADSTDNYLLVDEGTPDGDTTYVESATVNDEDLYEYEDMALTGGDIRACVLSSLIKLDPSGNKEFSHLTRIDGTKYETSNNLLFDNSYQLVEEIYELSPDTSSPWVESEVNAAQFGIKVKV